MVLGVCRTALVLLWVLVTGGLRCLLLRFLCDWFAVFGDLIVAVVFMFVAVWCSALLWVWRGGFECGLVDFFWCVICLYLWVVGFFLVGGSMW